MATISVYRMILTGLVLTGGLAAQEKQVATSAKEQMSQSPQSLADVRTIFVDSLGQG